MPKDYNLYLKGSVGSWNFEPDYVAYTLDKNKDKEVAVLIDSRGGRVDAALSISSLFKNHGNVHCHYVGMNASAATIASMGAKRITIDADALYLVHKCMNLVLEWDWLNADQLAEHIAKLEKMKADQDTIDGCIAGMYASRCKKPKDDLLKLMEKGAWLTAKQALEWGFVDEITDQPEDSKPQLTAHEASVMADAGIPMPPIQVKKDSLLEKLTQFFSSKFSSNTNQAQAEDKASAEAQNQNSSLMDKFKSLVALLAGATVAKNADNMFLLSEDLIKKVDDRLTADAGTISTLRDEATAKDTKISELEARIAELEKKPADSTTTVTDEKQTTDDGPGDDYMAAAESLLKQLS